MIYGKILIIGQLKTISPLHVGSGSGDRSDMDILLDKNNRPFIPATSLTGVLRHLIPINEKEDKSFWGYQADKNDGNQSRFRCSDLECDRFTIKIRDGIKIDSKKGMVFDTGKFDYEIVEPGVVFKLKLELSFAENDEQLVKKMASTIFHMLSKGISIGAKTNSGFGDVQLINDQTNIYLFDFKNKKHVFNWLKRSFSEKNIISSLDLGTPIKQKQSKQFSIEADFQLKNSLIVRSYSDKPKMPDSIHIKSGDKWVLPGTSLKGAIRARAERIANSLGVESIIDDLFGYVNQQSSAKGRVQIKEVILPELIAELQTRIKIDRFTGGTIQSALFDSMPVFNDYKNKVIRLNITIKNCSQAEAGLILLVLKDLWTQDLAVGGEKNVGRGILIGMQAIVEYDNDNFIIDNDLNKLSADKKEILQNYVNKLVLKDSK